MATMVEREVMFVVSTMTSQKAMETGITDEGTWIELSVV